MWGRVEEGVVNGLPGNVKPEANATKEGLLNWETTLASSSHWRRLSVNLCSCLRPPEQIRSQETTINSPIVPQVVLSRIGSTITLW